MRPTPRSGLAAALVVGGLVLTGCTAGDRQEAASAASSAGSAAASAAQSAGAAVTSAAPSVGAAAGSLASQAQSAAPSVGSAAASLGSGAASAAGSLGAQATSAAASASADHGQHHHGGAVPAGMKAAADAKYPTGTKVTVNADHMPGMKGTQGVVTGAYDTTAYQVDYTPTDGGAAVKDHKWVVQEELKDAAGKEAKVGDRVVLDADHMPGMKGATATVSGLSHRRVYTVDVTMPDGQVMKDHTWFISDELQPTS